MRLAAIRFPKNTEAIVGVDVNFGEVNDSLKIQNKKKKNIQEKILLIIISREKPNKCRNWP